MSGRPVLAASPIDSVLFPDPASPVTMTRRPTAGGAARIGISVAQEPSESAMRFAADVHDVENPQRRNPRGDVGQPGVHGKAR